MDLNTQGENQPVFKSVWDTTISEKTLTKQGRVFSDNSSMLKTMGAEEGTNTRSLRPREHMDKLSEYISNT